MLKLLIGALVLVLGLWARPVWAETTATTVVVGPGQPDEIDFFLGKRKDRPGAQDQARDRQRRRRQPTAPAKPVQYIMDVELRSDPVTGARCAYLFDRPGDPLGREAAENEIRSLRLVGSYGVCSSSPALPRAQPTPAVAAALAWERHVKLPEPVLAVAPGFVLTGKAAYLEVGGDREVHQTYDALGYRVTIDATATLDVDWGDGTVERGVTGKDGPWPEGEVTHVYSHTGHYTLVATRRWTARWRVGELSGVIADTLVTEGRLPLEARQLQAVRNR